MPADGTIRLADKPLAEWTPRARSQQLAWLAQQDDQPFPITVLEKVLTGAHARLGRWQWEGEAELADARRWLAELDLTALAERDMATLSGGERRRVSLAATLMQAAPLLLLDEPMAQLDVRHQLQALARLKRLCQSGQTVMLVSHDPNHALHWATHVLLLAGDGQWQAGPVQTVLTAEQLSRLYHVPVQLLRGPEGQTGFLPDAQAGSDAWR